ncbi:gamma-glutamylcyclotransferase family protein [Pirellulaceae bacterium SH501]
MKKSRDEGDNRDAFARVDTGSCDDNVTEWYFAYGSNLCADQMRFRLGRQFEASYADADFHARVVSLPHHRVSFNMLASDGNYYANLVPSRDDAMGVLYSCSPMALKILDEFESGYQRVTTRVFDLEGRVFNSTSYIAEQRYVSFAGRPTFEYLSRIVFGGMAHGIPRDYLLRIENAAGLSVTEAL